MRVVVTAPVDMPIVSASSAIVVVGWARPAAQSFSATLESTFKTPLRDLTPVVMALADGAESVTSASCE